MLPLLPLALSLAPGLAKWLFGAGAADTAQAVANVVQQATGTNDPDAAHAAVLADPKVASALTLRLAQIAAAREAAADATRQAELVAVLSDVASVRAQTLGLAEAHSNAVWGAPLLSLVILLAFGAMACSVLIHAIPAGNETLGNVLTGTLAAMATQVANYWLGSSAGSARKTEALTAARNQLANSAPVPGARL